MPNAPCVEVQTNQLAVLLPHRRRGVRLDVALVRHRGAELALDDDLRLGEARLGVAERHYQVLGDVGLLVGRLVALGVVGGLRQLLGAQVGVQHRGGVGHRLLHVQHRGQLLVLDLDQVEGVLGDVRVGRADGGDRVAAEDQLLVGEQEAAQPAQRRQAADRRDDAVAGVRQVRRGEHGEHALERLRLRGVDADQARVGDGAALDASVEHPRQPHVGAVPCPSGHLVGSVVADGAGSDHLVGLVCGDHARHSFFGRWRSRRLRRDPPCIVANPPAATMPARVRTPGTRQAISACAKSCPGDDQRRAPDQPRSRCGRSTP